jgi:hypothetical protein
LSHRFVRIFSVFDWLVNFCATKLRQSGRPDNSSDRRSRRRQAMGRGMAKGAEPKPIEDEWYCDAVRRRVAVYGCVEEAETALIAEIEAGLPYSYLDGSGTRVLGDARFFGDRFLRTSWDENWADRRYPVPDPAALLPDGMPSKMIAIRVAIPAELLGPGRKPGPNDQREAAQKREAKGRARLVEALKRESEQLASLESQLKREAEERARKEAEAAAAAAAEAREAAQKREAEARSKRKPGPGTERTYDYPAIIAAARRALTNGRPDLKKIFFDKVRAEVPKGTKMPSKDYPTLNNICRHLWNEKS